MTNTEAALAIMNGILMAVAISAINISGYMRDIRNELRKLRQGNVR